MGGSNNKNLEDNLSIGLWGEVISSSRTIAKGKLERKSLHIVHYGRGCISPHIDVILHREAPTRGSLKRETIDHETP